MTWALSDIPWAPTGNPTGRVLSDSLSSLLCVLDPVLTKPPASGSPPPQNDRQEYIGRRGMAGLTLRILGQGVLHGWSMQAVYEPHVDDTPGSNPIQGGFGF